MTACKWFEGCQRDARFEIKTTEGWKPMCRKHSDRYSHSSETRRIEAGQATAIRRGTGLKEREPATPVPSKAVPA